MNSPTVRAFILSAAIAAALVVGPVAPATAATIHTVSAGASPWRTQCVKP